MRKLTFLIVFLGLLTPVAEAQYGYYGWNSPVQQWQNSMFQMINGASVGYPGLYGYVNAGRFYPMGRIERTVVGAGIGASIGGGISGDWRGAAIGGGIGALIGVVTGRNRNNQKGENRYATARIPTVSSVPQVEYEMAMAQQERVIRYGSDANTPTTHIVYFGVEGIKFAELYSECRGRRKKVGDLFSGETFEYVSESPPSGCEFKAFAPAGVSDPDKSLSFKFESEPLRWKTVPFEATNGEKRTKIVFSR